MTGYNDAKEELNEEEGQNLEPVQISVFYESRTLPSAYTSPRVKIEIGSRSMREPYTNRQFSSLVGQNYPDSSFADTPVTFPCVLPERTFLEKVFLLHEEFQKPIPEIRVNRLSRHLYDIEKLMSTEHAENALRKTWKREVIPFWMKAIKNRDGSGNSCALLQKAIRKLSKEGNPIAAIRILQVKK